MTGAIVGFEGSWFSGMATLLVKDDADGKVRRLYCDNGPTVRALQSMFPECRSAGHCVDVGALKGQRIAYGMDGTGLIVAWISAADADADDEETPEE